VRVGGTATRTTREQLESAGRRLNANNYRPAFAEGDRPLNSPELQRLMESPSVVKAMKAANASGKDRAVAEGLGGFKSSVQVTDDGRPLFKTGKGGVPQFPNLQYWDSVKRELDDVAGRAFRTGSKSEGGVANTLAADLRNELDRLVPSYAKARSGAHQFFGAQDAHEAGQLFSRGNQNLTQARGALSKMNPAERELFRQGYQESLRDIALKTRDRTNVIDRLWGNPNVREKAVIALGPRRAAEMETFMRTEQIMDRARGAFGNSSTTRQLIEAGLGGTGFGIATGDISTENILTAAFVIGAGRRGLQRIDRRVMGQVAQMLVSANPVVVQRGVSRVARNPALLNALREGGRRLITSIGAPVGAIAP